MNDAVGRALDALGRRRAVGLHFFGHFLGVEGIDSGAGSAEMRLTGWDGQRFRSPFAVELGTLADLAMGQAIRSQMPEGLRLATSSLLLHQGQPTAVGPYVAAASVRWTDIERRTATAAVDIRDHAARLVAFGSGSFSALPPPGGTPLRHADWSVVRRGAIPPLDVRDLDTNEKLVVAAVEKAADRGDVIEELLGVAWWQDGAQLLGTLEAGPHLANRVGHLQGGVIYGVIADAGQRITGDGFRVVDVRVQYLRPAGQGPVTITAELLRQGRTAAFARVTVAHQGQAAAEGTVTLAAR